MIIWKILIILNLIFNLFILYILGKHMEAINKIADFLWTLYEKYKDTWHHSKYGKER